MQIAFLFKRCPEIRHDEISHEQYPLAGQVNEHSIVGFSSLHRDQLDTRSSDREFGAMVDRDVRLEAAYVFEVEAFAEEALSENPGPVEFASNLFLVIAPGIETQARIQGTKIGVSANVVPVGVCNEDRRQFRQTGRIPSQRFVGGLGGVRPRTGVDADQLSPIVRDDEIVFRELETGERVYPARHDLGNAPRRKSMPGQNVLRKRSAKRNWPIKVRVAASPHIVLCLDLLSVSEGQLSEVVVDFPQPPCLWRFVNVLHAPG